MYISPTVEETTSTPPAMEDPDLTAPINIHKVTHAAKEQCYACDKKIMEN